MSDINQLAQKFLKKKSLPSSDEWDKTFVHNSFRSLFESQDLGIEEKQNIRSLFAEKLQGSVAEDLEEIFRLTSELKSLQKQAILLVGERVYRVREIFKKYGEERGAFTLWLKKTFSSKKTAYNALSFYELYRHLPTEKLREQFKQMPAKASYILASRKGDFSAKLAVIDQYRGEKQEQLIERIISRFPVEIGDRRSSKTLTQKSLEEIERHVAFLQTRGDSLLCAEEKDRLLIVARIIESLCSIDLIK